MTAAFALLLALSGQPAETAVSGEGFVKGELRMSCPAVGWGRIRGSILLSGRVVVREPEGKKGDVWVSGSAFVEGTCFAGRFKVSQAVPVSGKGVIADAAGASRDVSVSGEARLEIDEASGPLQTTLFVHVSGR